MSKKKSKSLDEVYYESYRNLYSPIFPTLDDNTNEAEVRELFSRPIKAWESWGRLIRQYERFLEVQQDPLIRANLLRFSKDLVMRRGHVERLLGEVAMITGLPIELEEKELEVSNEQ